jgi:class 3 adenylate cyclase
MPAMSERSEVEGVDVRELYALRTAVDELIEEGLVRRWGVAEMLGALLPRVGERLGVAGAFVETFGEDLALHVYAWTAGAPDVAADADADIPQRAAVTAATSEARREKVRLRSAGEAVVAQHLDVAGAWFGRAGLVCPAETSDAGLARAQAGLEAMCEVLDNWLFSIRAMREKHQIMMRLGNALRHRVLGDGVKQAVGVLAEAIPIDRMLLVYVAEESASKTLHVQLFDGKDLRVDTLSAHGESHGPLRMLGREYLRGESTALLEHLGVHDAQEEVLINGITKSVVVGKIVVTSKGSPFNTYDRDLLSAFAGYIRQRIVDFNKEWRALATAFRPDDVGRLLMHDGYERTFLAPREETVGILYCDIAGFTKLSEQVLKTPAKVAELVEHWSRDAVDIVWQHGGVFDKMVGDCIIALFGPPFYDEAPGERLAKAIACARDVRAMTNELPKRVMFEALRETGVAVSTGVNLAPLFVGQFGPNSNFTGFSSGMNNTARLQGCAVRDEILVMDDALAALPEGHGFRFGEVRSTPVKNVADPLRYRALA